MKNLFTPSIELKQQSNWQETQNFAEKVNQILICYNSQTKEPIPLLKVNYVLTVKPGMVIAKIEQSYQPNLSGQQVDLEYMFCVDENASITQMIVELGDKKAYGIIKEKEEAKKEYEKGKQDGNTMAYSEQSGKFPEIKTVKIGCLQSQENLKITFEYIQPIKVYLNKFWQIIVSPMVDSNLVSVENLKNARQNYPNLYAFVNQKVNLELQKLNYTQNITVDIDFDEPIIFIKSPTHSIKSELIQQNQNVKNSQITRITLEDKNENYSPQNQFILLFTTENVNKPRVYLTHSINDAFQTFKYCATLTFIPKLYEISVEDAYQQYINDLSPSNPYLQRSRYIFFIDRSGSMSGYRINKAKQALILFLKSLPLNSEFNIVSFGSSFSKMASSSMHYCFASVDFALNYVNQMNANFGGTDIFSALSSIIYDEEYKSNPDVPLNVFLLTDGEDEPSRIIDIVQKNTRPETRIYTLGIGRDCNQYLIKRVAEVGNGKHHFADNDDIDSKVIDLLEDSMAPYLKAIQLTTSVQQIHSIIPDPEQIINLRRNEELTIQVLFTSKQNNDNLQFEIKCFDPQLNKQLSHQCNANLKSSIPNENFHKLAGHKLIQQYQIAESNRLDKVGVKIQSEKLSDSFIIMLAIQYQILSSKTAFVCQVCKNENEIAKEAKKKMMTIPSQEKDMRYSEKQVETTLRAQSYMPLKSMSKRRVKSSAKQQCQSSIQYEVDDREALEKELLPIECCCNNIDLDALLFYATKVENIQIEQNDQIELNDIIMLSQPDGRFISNERMENFLKKAEAILNNVSKEQIYTILVLFYLEFQFSEKKSSWKLILQKGINYLLSQQIDYLQIKQQYFSKFQSLFSK